MRQRMEDPQAGQVPPVSASSSESWAHVPPASQSYPPPPNGEAYGQYPPPAYAAPAADQGLSDTAAGALAYITIIPAIIFLVMEPYNRRPFVKFHAFQCLGLAVVWFCLGIIRIVPIIGLLIMLVGSLALLVCWVMSIIKASQGSYFKLPVISEFAAKQSGYVS